MDIGVIGAGAMGRGIAQVCAAAGCEVRLFDSQPAAVEAARAVNQPGFLTAQYFKRFGHGRQELGAEHAHKLSAHASGIGKRPE